MNEFIVFTALVLIALYVTYGKLRERIKSLEEQISAQLLRSNKLREANCELQAELRRIESRIDSQDWKNTTISKPTPTASELEAPAPILGKTEPPPPLPPTTSVTRPEPEPAPAWENPRPSDIPFPAAPSFFSRVPWHDILKRLHLLPPGRSESGETAESQIAAWWVIRIGLVLLIIAAVFFGIYVSQHTPAWLRVMTLGLVSVGTICLGSQMKEKLQGFGRAIIGGGFALLYFTAFAAFALPATKIIVSPVTGVLAQSSALGIAILWSLCKRDQTVATLTLFLGFVSCGFSHSHDLDRFAFVGLVLLAATGSFLFAIRGWLTPFITSLSGSWIGFGIFVLLDWHRGDAPVFSHLMVTLAALTALFEAGNLAGAARSVLPPGDRLRRWLVLSNTSAAALLGYGVTRLIHPAQLPTFYFSFAVMYLFFTAVHHVRTTDRAVTESLFLKSSALLCLGFAAAFSGPVRWLAIAFEGFALLWTARRSGSRWVALGFALVVAASIGWFWHDLIIKPPTGWRWLDAFRISGSLYLVFLTVQLVLHSRWFPEGIGGTDEEHQNHARTFRWVGSLVVGVSALVLSFIPSFPGHCDPVWFLFLLSIVIGLVCPIMRGAVPCMAAALPLASSYVAYAALPSGAGPITAALSLGVALIIAAFILAEMIRRFWPESMHGGTVLREVSLLAGLATLLPFSIDFGRTFSLSGNSGIGIFALFPACACAAVLSRQQTTASGCRARLSFAFQAAVGILVLAGGAVTCHSSGFFPSALAIAGLPLLFLAKRVRVWNIALAGTIPVLGGFVSLWRRLLDAQPGDLAEDSINLAVLLAISIGLAIFVCKRATNARLQRPALWCDALLHGLGVFSLHLFFQKHLGDGPDFLAAGLLGVVLFAVSRRSPFRTLGGVSWLPVALACFSSLLSENRYGCPSGEIWFIAAGLLVLAHLVAASHLSRIDLDSKFGLPEIRSGVATLAWTVIALAATKTPWQPGTLTGVALICSALWRWRTIPLIGHLGLGPLTLAVCMAADLMFSGGPVPGPAAWTLTSILLTSGGLAANGMIMASGVRRVMGRKITAASRLPWFHAGSALSIAFSACAIDRLASDDLTAVFWGISAILLFVSGLFAGLRAYRLTGLIGLVFCTGHIFIWDIQDTFYRIIAFFVIGLVMLAIGFLYHRFRERISALDS